MKHQTNEPKPRTRPRPEEGVQDAARQAPDDPQGATTLRDQRDRTTGADQATRQDMHAKAPHTLKDTSKPRPTSGKSGSGGTRGRR